jgi:hypothetical protein
MLDSTSSYAGWIRAQQQALGAPDQPLNPFTQYVLMIPETLSVPHAVVDLINRRSGSILKQCLEAPLERCAIIAVDLLGGKELEYVFVVRIPGRWIQFQAFKQQNSEWVFFADWSVARRSDTVWAALLAGDFETEVPDFRILKVGKQTMPFLPR